MDWSEDQKKVISAAGSEVLVSAAAGSGKTTVMVERIISLISDPVGDVGLDEMVIMTFTRAAALNMKDKIRRSLDERLLAKPSDRKLMRERNLLPRASVSTIHSFCQELIRQHTEDLDIDPDFRLADDGETSLMHSDVLSAMFEDHYSDLYDADFGDEPDDRSPYSDYYADPESFRRLAETFNVKTMDDSASDIILMIYRFSMGRPHPMDYLGTAIRECTDEKGGAYGKSRWFLDFMQLIKNDISDHVSMLGRALDICSLPGGPAKYIPVIEECLDLSKRISGSDSYASMRTAVLFPERFRAFPRLSKKDVYDPSMQTFVRTVRDGFKAYITSVRKGFFLLPEEALELSASGAADMHKTLMMLAAEFAIRYSLMKRERNVLDYDDLEHKALELLYIRKESSDGGKVRYMPSVLADRLAQNLKEIMVDEYQDSSEVQEALIGALSAERFGRYDVFMVGDVKQSIYRFRNARPQLFTEKLQTFEAYEGAPKRKIELSANYRSRKEVLDSVNDVFDRVMSAEYGGIEYDEAARLKAMASYPPSDDAITELLILEAKKDDMDQLVTAMDAVQAGTPYGGSESESDGVELSAAELEFKLIASRIHELVDTSDPSKSFKVRDSRTGLMRPAAYRDITILIRKKRPAARLREVLEENRIPAYFEEDQGYFEAREVDLILSFLNIIDNPLQDIPLASVMKSPIGDFDDSELALIRADYIRARGRDYSTAPGDFYRALRYAACGRLDEGESAEEESVPDEDRGADAMLRAKAAGFLGLLDEFRDYAAIMPVHVLINEIYTRTGYCDYAAALPGGQVRRKNLEMLVDKAESFEKTNYQGLFNFTRYIEALKKSKTDMGEASVVSENDNIVRISTIHKSKGLEFPIVILARAGAPLSGKANDGGFVIDEYGLGSDYTDTRTGIKYPGLKKAFIKKTDAYEEKAEEQRLLYVAMTRAMEKLIITASVRDIQKNVEKLMEEVRAVDEVSGAGKKLPKTVVSRAKSYLDWILMAAALDCVHFKIRYFNPSDIALSAAKEAVSESIRYTGIKKAAAAFQDTDGIYAVSRPDDQPEVSYREQDEALPFSGGAGGDFMRQNTDDTGADGLRNAAADRYSDEEEKALCAKLSGIFSSSYAYEAETRLRPKVSVSEIKRMSSENEGTFNELPGSISPEADQYVDYDDDILEIDDEGYPAADRTPGRSLPQTGRGALKGTAFHRAMELLDYHGSADEQLLALFRNPLFQEEYRDILDKRAVADFIGSSLGARMAAALSAGRLWRERHFMAGFPARTLIASQDTDELQLLQGIIDAYFEEDGEIVIVDFKTDYGVTSDDLLARYRTQLELYQRALSMLTGMHVKESVIYSTFLKKEIVL